MNKAKQDFELQILTLGWRCKAECLFSCLIASSSYTDDVHVTEVGRERFFFFFSFEVKCTEFLEKNIREDNPSLSIMFIASFFFLKKKRTTERLKESDGKPSSFSFVIEDDGNRNVILKCIYSLAFVTTWR